MVSQVKNRRLQLRELYGFDFPEDLFRFWEFVNRLAPLEPLTAVYPTTRLQLVGPFEVLAGRFDGRTPAYPQHLHWRYANDPPEFFTVLSGGTDGLHHGYYLDDPTTAAASCVASYYAGDAFELEANSDTLFAAVRLELEQHDRDCAESQAVDPANAGAYAAKRAEIEQVRRKLQRYATADRAETGEAYVEKYLGVRPARLSRVTAPTREGMGIVVPPRTYRPLSVPDKQLGKALRKKDELAVLVEEARTALRAGYPGTALKLGKELWATGTRRSQACDLLDTAYADLGRDVLRQVLANHRAFPNLPFVDILHVAEGE